MQSHRPGKLSQQQLIYGTGDQVGSGNYVVAKGATTATITDLQPNTVLSFCRIWIQWQQRTGLFNYGPRNYQPVNSTAAFCSFCNFILPLWSGEQHEY